MTFLEEGPVLPALEVRTASDTICNSFPCSFPKFLYAFSEEIVFLFGPFLFRDIWVQNAMPMLVTLDAVLCLNVTGNLAPIAKSEESDSFKEKFVFI